MLRKTTWALLVVMLLLIVWDGFSFNRWFKVRPGLRIAGMAVDMDSRVPSNSTTTRFDFGVGMTLNLQLEKYIGLDIDFLYLRKGSEVGNGGSRIVLHYLSIPTLAKFWISRNKFAVAVGPVHNFLLGANGRLSNPRLELNGSTTSAYDLGIAFGMQYVIATFDNGTQFVGDFRFEFGLLNVNSGYRPELYNRTAPYLALGLNF